MRDKEEFIGTFMGKDINQMSREELLVVIRHLAKSDQKLRADCDRYRRNVDWDKFLREERS